MHAAGAEWLGSAASPSGSARLVATRDPEEFVASPIGRCVLGSAYLVWCQAPDLLGAIVWGTVDDRVAHDLLALGRCGRHPALAPRRRVLVDCRAVERVDSETLLQFCAEARGRVAAGATAIASPGFAGARSNADALRSTIERRAVVVPAGIAGLLIAGLLPLAGISLPVHVTEDLKDAFAYVAHPSAERAHAMADRIVTVTTRRSELLSRVRSLLRSDLATASIDDVATRLGMSSRTLQRELGRLDTSFRNELLRARVAAAEALLVHSDLKIDAIAVQTGFGTGSRLCSVLREELQATPSDLRERARSLTTSIIDCC